MGRAVMKLTEGKDTKPNLKGIHKVSRTRISLSTSGELAYMWCQYMILFTCLLASNVVAIKLSELIANKKTLEVVHGEKTENYFCVETAKGIRHTISTDMLANLISFQKKEPEKISIDVRKIADKAIVSMHHKGDVEDDLGYSSGTDTSPTNAASPTEPKSR